MIELLVQLVDLAKSTKKLLFQSVLLLDQLEIRQQGFVALLGEPQNYLVEQVYFLVCLYFLLGEQLEEVSIHGEGVAKVGDLVFEAEVLQIDKLLPIHV